MDKRAKRQRVKEVMQVERARQRDFLPVSPSIIRGLLRHVDMRLSNNTCDHTRRFANEFIATSSLPPGEVERWLDEHGGYCDCEVVTNVWQIFEDFMSDADA